MEYSLCSLDSAMPVEITLDEDNGRYMVRKSDTSGEVFNSASELIEWITHNFKEEQFCTPEEFRLILKELQEYDGKKP
ncbi:hypothetical protein V1498_08460 [Peribacillus sp. SCS-26]|uniref:hypothetical protein n=1 Tax=Paraperibacillus marinus TaxID=3115295 RepID=UPI0039064846